RITQSDNDAKGSNINLKIASQAGISFGLGSFIDGAFTTIGLVHFIAETAFSHFFDLYHFSYHIAPPVPIPARHCLYHRNDLDKAGGIMRTGYSITTPLASSYGSGCYRRRIRNK